jgi:hypothetical protein
MAAVIEDGIQNHGLQTEIGAHGNGLSWKFLNLADTEFARTLDSYGNFQHGSSQYRNQFAKRDGGGYSIPVATSTEGGVYIDPFLDYSPLDPNKTPTGNWFRLWPQTRQDLVRALEAIHGEPVRIIKTSEESNQLWRFGKVSESVPARPASVFENMGGAYPKGVPDAVLEQASKFLNELFDRAAAADGMAAPELKTLYPQFKGPDGMSYNMKVHLDSNGYPKNPVLGEGTTYGRSSPTAGDAKPPAPLAPSNATEVPQLPALLLSPKAVNQALSRLENLLDSPSQPMVGGIYPKANQAYTFLESAGLITSAEKEELLNLIRDIDLAPDRSQSLDALTKARERIVEDLQKSQQAKALGKLTDVRDKITAEINGQSRNGELVTVKKNPEGLALDVVYKDGTLTWHEGYTITNDARVSMPVYAPLFSASHKTGVTDPDAAKKLPKRSAQELLSLIEQGLESSTN